MKNCIMVIIVTLKQPAAALVVVKLMPAAGVGMIKMMSKLIGGKTDSKLVMAYQKNTVKHYI